jgi:hypothetical protein
MKKFAVGLAAAVFSSMFLFPVLGAQAHDWRSGDLAADAYAINRQQRELHHDYHELRHALRHGNYGAAVHEQREIARRRARIARMQRDLNRDWYSSRYGYGPYSYGYGPYYNYGNGYWDEY